MPGTSHEQSQTETSKDSRIEDERERVMLVGMKFQHLLRKNFKPNPAVKVIMRALKSTSLLIVWRLKIHLLQQAAILKVMIALNLI